MTQKELDYFVDKDFTNYAFTSVARNSAPTSRLPRTRLARRAGSRMANMETRPKNATPESVIAKFTKKTLERINPSHRIRRRSLRILCERMMNNKNFPPARTFVAYRKTWMPNQ
jgi:hypothetical protein